jgi:two-component system CheB/CheR fusion protein
LEARRQQLIRNGQPSLLNMTLRPVREGPTGSELLLVLFDELEATLSQDGSAASKDKDPLAVELEAELQRVNERLQGTIGESEASTEALRASNEELQAINEELRSATEELETGKEELQSLNEELITVNAELKSKVEEAAEVNDDLNNLISSTDIATLFVDADLCIKRYTPPTAKVFNVIPSDIGRSVLDLTHRLDYPELAEDAALVFQSLQAVEREVRSADGRWYLVRVLPYRTTEDRIDGAVFNFIDVNARRAAEDALRSREQYMRLVAESTKDFAIITFDAGGLVTSWNHGAERIFGYAEAEALGQYGAFIFTDEDRARGAPEEEMSRAQRDGRAEDERWHRRKDGSTFYCSGIMTPFEAESERGFAKIARDLTHSKVLDRRREAVLSAEKELRSQLQAANALKDEFLAVMSHELKNPLNLILLNAELLTRFPEVRGVPVVARAAETIRRTVRSQAKIIDDLLDLSRMHTGKLTLNVAPFDYKSTLERIVDAIRPDAEQKHIRLSLAVDGEDIHINADPVRVEQIAWNLLSNALKFTPEGGSVDVKLAREGVCARLDVTDSGRGIPPELGARVFDMFQQGDARTTREHGGLGIGLALVKSLSELHGGHADVFSAGMGLGARFSVWLPVHDVITLRSADAASDARLSGLRVLVVDDAVETLDAFRELLELEGANVTVAHSGAEALSRAETAGFDLLLSDVGMPGMDGYQLIAELRKMPRHARLPAVAVTGFGRTQDEIHALEAGFNAHISKPVSLDRLLAIVAGFSAPSEPV